MAEIKKEVKIGAILDNLSVPVSKRMRAIYALRSMATNDAIDAMKNALSDSSALIAHEVAYCMGQLKNPHAVPALVSTLSDESIHPMVRHEAAEALGAIGGDEAEQVLNKFKDHKLSEIKDTCSIALSLSAWKKQNAEKKDANSDHPVYHSVDPAPPAEKKSVTDLRAQLLDHNISLFERYKAMFALRNTGTPEAIEALGAALSDEASGPVFTHEIAYVLGQIRNKDSIQVLSDALKNTSLNCMVRHEAAQALGNIGDEKITELLKQYTEDVQAPVKESCHVALDILDYFTSDQFEYALSDSE